MKVDIRWDVGCNFYSSKEQKQAYPSNAPDQDMTWKKLYDITQFEYSQK